MKCTLFLVVLSFASFGAAAEDPQLVSSSVASGTEAGTLLCDSYTCPADVNTKRDDNSLPNYSVVAGKTVAPITGKKAADGTDQDP